MFRVGRSIARIKHCPQPTVFIAVPRKLHCWKTQLVSHKLWPSPWPWLHTAWLTWLECQLESLTHTSFLLQGQNFTRIKFKPKKRVNYKKRILRQNSTNQDLLGQATKKCVKLHTECKSTLGLCKNKIIHTNYTKCVKLRTECKCCVMLDGCKLYTHCINHTHLCNKRCV